MEEKKNKVLLAISYSHKAETSVGNLDPVGYHVVEAGFHGSYGDIDLGTTLLPMKNLVVRTVDGEDHEVLMPLWWNEHGLEQRSLLHNPWLPVVLAAIKEGND